MSTQTARSRLGVWTRLGIVLSVLWLAGACGWVAWKQHQDSDAWGQVWVDSCKVDMPQARQPGGDCSTAYGQAYWMVARGKLPAALLHAIAPVPIAWIAIWGAVASTRWVLRGRG